MVIHRRMSRFVNGSSRNRTIQGPKCVGSRKPVGRPEQLMLLVLPKRLVLLLRRSSAGRLREEKFEHYRQLRGCMFLLYHVPDACQGQNQEFVKIFFFSLQTVPADTPDCLDPCFVWCSRLYKGFMPDGEEAEDCQGCKFAQRLGENPKNNQASPKSKKCFQR